MAFEKQQKMPDGIGKKIIEALKSSKTTEAEETYSADFSTYKQSEYKDYNYEKQASSTLTSPYQEYINTPSKSEPIMQNVKEEKDSSSINTLVDLVTKLPPGVTKQTGAQIIRHTMEAMGISMHKVLTNAQIAQEELEYNIKTNSSIIEEYKLKIKILESEIQHFRKKSKDLEDIINLFILSDKNV